MNEWHRQFSSPQHIFYRRNRNYWVFFFSLGNVRVTKTSHSLSCHARCSAASTISLPQQSVCQGTGVLLFNISCKWKLACFALSLLYFSQTLTWFANIKVHSSPHVEYFLDNDFGQGSRTEQDRSSPLCPLEVDGTIGDQVQTPAQVAVWLSSIYSETETAHVHNYSYICSPPFTGCISVLISYSLNDDIPASPHIVHRHFNISVSAHFSTFTSTSYMSVQMSSFINCPYSFSHFHLSCQFS